MTTIKDPITAIIAGLTIICCILAFRHFWKVRNTDACMWVIVSFFLSISIISKSL